MFVKEIFLGRATSFKMRVMMEVVRINNQSSIAHNTRECTYHTLLLRNPIQWAERHATTTQLQNIRSKRVAAISNIISLGSEWEVDKSK